MELINFVTASLSGGLVGYILAEITSHIFRYKDIRKLKDLKLIRFKLLVLLALLLNVLIITNKF